MNKKHRFAGKRAGEAGREIAGHVADWDGLAAVLQNSHNQRPRADGFLPELSALYLRHGACSLFMRTPSSNALDDSHRRHNMRFVQ